ncbi:hypothetical protein Mterra_03832 [Calidithermus terrae]|uniref:Uncharacterized protein n=1 Tax=Calidithermus terrae TaxID=1408545 RepID=A0A399DXD0_9DEIN|nr:hypothetical protein [Calidithermus terrae]RIH76855.1 hypothetical protein Mterra_03832 [Calidithermus terrae]
MSELYKLIYGLLDSVLVGEYGVLTRTRGMVALLSEDLPDGAGWVDGLSDAEVQELWQLLRQWEGLRAFVAARDAFLAAGIEPEGRRVLAWGLRREGTLRLEAFDCYHRGARLELGEGGQAANYALAVIEEMMRAGVCPRLSAPLHFGWEDEAAEILRRCAQEAEEAGLTFPSGQIEGLLELLEGPGAPAPRRPGPRGFGFARGEGVLLWLVVGRGEGPRAGGFAVVAFGVQRPGGAVRIERGVQA